MRTAYMRHWLAIALLCTGGPVAAAEDELPVTPEAYVYCTVCHGIQLMGNPIIKAPRMSGMETWYIEKQLLDFKEGLRGTHDDDLSGIEMQPMAAALSGDQIRKAATFVAATRSPAPVPTVDGDINHGRSLYSSCAACHGRNGEGNETLGTPSLTIPDDWYLVTQLRNYKSGARGNLAGDTYGMQMRSATRSLNDDQDIIDVVSYINTLRKN